MLEIGPDTFIYENYQEVNKNWHNNEFSRNATGNLPNNWKLEIANAYMVYQQGYSEYYQEYMPMDLWENPRFMYEAYNIIISNLDMGFNFPGTISDKVVNSPEFFKILSIAPQCLENLYFRQYKQIEFFKAIIQTNPVAFLYCLPRIQKSHTYVLEAVKINGHCLEYAAFNLKADKIIVTTALNNTPYAIRHAQKQLSNDSKYFVDAITKCIEEDDSQSINQCSFDNFSIHEKFWSDIYTNKQLERMVVKFKDKKIRSRLYEIWKNRSLENDVLLLAKMKKRFLG